MWKTLRKPLLPLFYMLFLSVPESAAWGLENGSGIQVETLAKSTKSWNGTALPAYGTGQPEVTLLRIRIAPGTTLPTHLHPIINAGVLLSGALTVETEAGDVLHLKAGDPIIEVVDQWHLGRNEGTVPADIIVFYAGTEGAALSIKKE